VRASKTETITVNIAPVASFEYDADGVVVDFTDTSSDANGTIASWEWDFGDGNTSTEQNPTHTYTMDGVYTVRLQITGFISIDVEEKAAFIRVGSSESTFKRGEVNNDGRFDLSDGVSVLNFLFRGQSIDCEDAADTDDSGRVELTDGIRIFRFLFADGLPPAPPYPDPDVDPTPDSLTPWTR